MWQRQTVLAAVVVSSLACGQRHSGKPEDNPGGGAQNTCTTNAECTNGQVCLGGTCQAPQDGLCVRDTDCELDEYCAAGNCAPRNTAAVACEAHTDCSFGQFCNYATHQCVECLNDDHCDLGLVCRADGSCGTTQSGCTSNSDCGALKCLVSASTCVQCLSSADCPAGQTCRENACFIEEGGDGIPCTSQAQCDPYGKVCDLPSSKCRNCAADNECGADRVCQAGTCTADPGTPPNGGETCLTPDDCGGQACFIGSCMPCFADFMCMDIMSVLLGGPSLICDIFSGTCVEGECATADDCAPGDACYSGHCGACLYDDECRAGEACDPDTGVCGAGGGGGGGGGGDCSSNADCTGGLICWSGDCVTCIGDYECNSGQTCSDEGLCTGGSGGGGGGGGGGGSGTLGTACADSTACGAGFVCLSGSCARPCIGSGKGGDADCPSGYACQNFNSGSFDGVQLCTKAASMPSGDSGQPYNVVPGGACPTGKGCQTSGCFTDTDVCIRACLANRDCQTGEVCWAQWSEGSAGALHFCMDSDTSSFTAAGGSCSNGEECDSGICTGTCSDSGNVCNSDADCGWLVYCDGTCVNHCRSNIDCPTPDACAPWPMQTADGAYSSWVPACQPRLGSGTRTNGSACTQHTECASDWCVAGICTTMCGINADCSVLSGSSCTVVNFVDDSAVPQYSGTFCLK